MPHLTTEQTLQAELLDEQTKESKLVLTGLQLLQKHITLPPDALEILERVSQRHRQLLTEAQSLRDAVLSGVPADLRHPLAITTASFRRAMEHLLQDQPVLLRMGECPSSIPDCSCVGVQLVDVGVHDGQLQLTVSIVEDEPDLNFEDPSHP